MWSKLPEFTDSPAEGRGFELPVALANESVSPAEREVPQRQHLSEAIRRGPKIPPPAVDQTRRHVDLTRHVPRYRTGAPECRRHNRLILLDAPPAL
jgi:hypothetical protein